MSLLRVDASINPAHSRSRAIADIVEQEWRDARPDDAVVSRHLGTEPVPATAWGAAVSASQQPRESWTDLQTESVALATGEVDRLVEAGALLLAAPLYNFGVSQHVKSWIDLVVTDPRMAAGAVPATKGTPAVLVVVRGGSYAAGTPRAGWDHATGWLRRILADVWQMQLEVVEQEFTLVGVNPALDQFTDLATGLRATAEEQAHVQGCALAQGQIASA